MSASQAGAPAGLQVSVGERRLHLPLEVVEAVVLTPPITPVPGTPSQLAGLFNHHGAIYPALQPLPDPVAAGRHAVLVRSARFGRFALLCDWAGDLVEEAEAEPLDVDALAERVLAAYASVDQRLPVPTAPRAIVRLRRPAAAPGSERRSPDWR
ncbi:MAG TPA: chemotaxis protein CheW [Chloroflexota bacterium]